MSKRNVLKRNVECRLHLNVVVSVLQFFCTLFMVFGYVMKMHDFEIHIKSVLLIKFQV